MQNLKLKREKEKKVNIKNILINIVSLGYALEEDDKVEFK